MAKKSRRDIIKNSFFSSLGLFLSTKMSNLSLVAQVQAQELDPAFLEHKLLNFSQGGGGSRWYWDLPLTPNGATDKFAPNPMCITRFGSNIKGVGEYRTTKLGEYYFPEMWNTNIPTPNGSVPMKNLANNMLVIRGIKLANAGHISGLAEQMQPLPGYSLMGIVADQSKLPLPALVGHQGHYYSRKGTPGVGLGTSAIGAFRPPWYEAEHLSVKDASVSGKIDEALLAMKDSTSTEKHRFIPKTYQQRLAAKKLLKKDFSSLDDVFKGLETKYENLMKAAFHEAQYNIPGVEDRAIPGERTNAFVLAGNHYVGSDLREIFGSDMYLMGNVPAACATAEFMITEGYSSCFTSVSGGIDGLSKKNFTAANDVTQINYDVHDTGSHIALLKYTKIYKAYSSMFHELIGKLKSTKNSSGESMFDKSLLTFTGDFNRHPRLDGSGADHGYTGMSYTIFSGKVDKVTVTGDVAVEEGSKWGGSWGYGAKLDYIGKRPLNIGNAASTVCTMLGAKSITPNDETLVRLVDGKVRTILGKPKNV